jgi:hypothetical protein
MSMNEPQLSLAIPPALQELADAGLGLLEGFDDRARRILAERLLATSSPTTLEALGQEFSLTRERVRQVEVAIRKKIETRLGFPAFQSIVRAGEALSEQLGLAFPATDLTRTASLFASSSVTAANPFLLPLLLWIGGPYEQKDGWMVRKPYATTMTLLESVLPTNAEIVPFENLSVQLSDLGVNSTHHKELIGFLGCRQIEGQVLTWRGSLADKAFALLSAAGQPLTREQISSQIPEEHSIRTLGNYLFYDKRFRRINLSQFALASWGHPLYKGIVQELSDEITRSGGEAMLHYLRETLIAKFGISESSVVSYLNSPLFARTSSGGFRLRRDDEDVVVQTRVDLTRSCFELNGNWAYRLKIDDELSRGSGRNIPSGFAQAIGVTPGTARSYQTEFGEYKISWAGPQPIIGSVRRFIEKNSLQNGDWIYIVPQIDDASFETLKQSEICSLDNISKLCRECSLSMSADFADALPMIARSLGLDPMASTWGTVKRRLLERRELELVALVPDDETEDDTSTIADLLEYIG